ncbi:MAG TPA: hypothetical protein VN759_05270 [Pseudolysinimonas sp.]|nr:hypothetical protein [Pseudolysinimonas sp.]
MSDATPPPPAPEQPVTPPPAAAAAPAYAPGTPGPKQALSITGFILGIGSIVFLWVPVFGLLVGVAGLIVSLLARGREPQAPNWMKLLGLILSIVGLALSLIYFIFWIILIVAAASSASLYSY